MISIKRAAVRYYLLHILLCLLSFRGFCQHTVLWKISRPGSPQVSWMIGTQHTLGESFVDSFPKIKECLMASDLLVSEAPTDRKAILEAIKARPASDTLKNMVTAKQLDQIRDIYKRSSVDIFKLTSSELFMQLTIFYFEYTCYPPSLNDKFTCDEYLQQMASDRHLPGFFFETYSMQDKLLRDQSAKMNWKYFHKRVGYLLEMYKMKAIASVCKIVWDYLAFNIAYDFDKDCTDKDVVENRNAAWMTQLPEQLDAHNCFIDVGLQHLCNRCGLIVRLRAMGYKVEPVAMK